MVDCSQKERPTTETQNRRRRRCSALHCTRHRAHHPWSGADRRGVEAIGRRVCAGVGERGCESTGRPSHLGSPSDRRRRQGRRGWCGHSTSVLRGVDRSVSRDEDQPHCRTDDARRTRRLRIGGYVLRSEAACRLPACPREGATFRRSSGSADGGSSPGTRRSARHARRNSAQHLAMPTVVNRCASRT